jgi:hypothetical protein
LPIGQIRGAIRLAEVISFCVLGFPEPDVSFPQPELIRKAQSTDQLFGRAKLARMIADLYDSAT